MTCLHSAYLVHIGIYSLVFSLLITLVIFNYSIILKVIVFILTWICNLLSLCWFYILKQVVFSGCLTCSQSETVNAFSCPGAHFFSQPAGPVALKKCTSVAKIAVFNNRLGPRVLYQIYRLFYINLFLKVAIYVLSNWILNL